MKDLTKVGQALPYNRYDLGGPIETPGDAQKNAEEVTSVALPALHLLIKQAIQKANQQKRLETRARTQDKHQLKATKIYDDIF